MNHTELKRQFNEKGFLVLRKVFNRSEINYFVEQLKIISANQDKRWTLPNGLCQHAAFWPTLFNRQILDTVKEVLGADIKFLQHNDLHVGFSSFAWHRDSVNRKYGIGPDWNETQSPYQLVRVGMYFQETSSEFKLGLIPGTHRPKTLLEKDTHQKTERLTSSANSIWSKIRGKNPVDDKAEWVETNPGDVIIFDPRVLHTGSEFSGKKFSIFSAFGIANQHFENHYRYYRYLRNDLGYNDLPPALITALKERDLYIEIPPSDQKIEGAWLPGKIFQTMAKGFKS